MARRRRYFRSNRPYEITLRVREGIPFPPWDLINLLLRSALARTQRDNKVTLCHQTWMGNHLHMLAVLRDADQAKKFYMELQRKITEYLKRLLDLEHLSLWEGRPSVAEILDYETVVDRIQYLYCNPARAGLESSISLYPGENSWKAFISGAKRIEEKVPWIRAPALSKLPSHKISRAQDQAIIAELTASARINHTLVFEPDAWCDCFEGVTEERISKARRDVIEGVAHTEAELSAMRAKGGKRVIGAARLKEASISQPHKPSAKERSPFVLSSDAELRTSYIKKMDRICDHCAELYELAKTGAAVPSWPPGTFRPPLPPMASAIGEWG